MNMKANFYRLIVLAVFLTCGLSPAMAEEGKKFKVLVVMSYEEDFQWCKDIKEGIDSVMGKTCETRYFYMDTKNNIAGGEQKAKEAYALYQEFKPDGVIVSDDDAQAMFVLPYLKDKVKTPVMFNGVNAQPDKYGYPASNISGVLERLYIGESIALAQQLVPSLKTVGYMIKDSPVAKIVFKQIESESSGYSAKSVAFKTPKTQKEAVAMAEELGRQCDLLFYIALAGMPGDDGKPLTEKEAVKIVLKSFGKPAIAVIDYDVKYGALCGLRYTGNEHGEVSANMLLKAMTGTPVSQIPITRNYTGKRMINVTVLKALGITPKPAAIKGAELVKTEE